MTPVHAQYVSASQQDSDIKDHLGVLYELAVGLGARTVIELGVRSGVSTTAWLAALEVTGGRLISVDLAGKPNLERGDVPWLHIEGHDTSRETYARISTALQGECPDIVFIDSSHHYGHTKDEINMYLNFKPRILAFHDSELERPSGTPDDDPPFPVAAAVNELLGGFDHLHYPGCYGLTVVKVNL